MRALLALALVLAATVTLASPGPGTAWPAARSRPVVQAEGITLDQAVELAEKRYGARAVKAEERREDGRRVYRIRLLSEDGRVFDVTVDAATGRME